MDDRPSPQLPPSTNAGLPWTWAGECYGLSPSPLVPRLGGNHSPQEAEQPGTQDSHRCDRAHTGDHSNATRTELPLRRQPGTLHLRVPPVLGSGPWPPPTHTSGALGRGSSEAACTPMSPAATGRDLVQPEEVDGHVLQPAGLPDEAQCSLLGAEAPLLAVHGGRMSEDVGAAPLGDDLRTSHRLSGPARPSPPTAPPQGLTHCGK